MQNWCATQQFSDIHTASFIVVGSFNYFTDICCWCDNWIKKANACSREGWRHAQFAFNAHRDCCYLYEAVVKNRTGCGYGKNFSLICTSRCNALPSPQTRARKPTGAGSKQTKASHTFKMRLAPTHVYYHGLHRLLRYTRRLLKTLWHTTKKYSPPFSRLLFAQQKCCLNNDCLIFCSYIEAKCLFWVKIKQRCFPCAES